MAAGLLDLRVGQWPESGFTVHLPPEVHQQSIYALGLSGTGKSTLLGTCALQWSKMGEGVLLIDVKDGRLARDVAKRADPDKLVYVAPGLCFFDGHPHHWALNVMEPPFRNRFGFEIVKSNVVSMFERMARADFSVMTQVRRHLDHAVRLANYERDATLLTVYDILTKQRVRQDLIARVKQRGVAINPIVLGHWEQFDDPKMMSVYARYQALSSTLARLEEMIAPQGLMHMVAQPRSTITLGPWLMAGKIVVVDCASGQMTEDLSELFGNLILAQAMHHAFMRRPETYLDDAAGDDPDGPFFRFICDEFDLLAGSNFAKLITKARSYKVLPVMAHQNKSQIANRDKEDRLLNATSGVSVEFEFTLTDQDRAQMRRLRPSEDEEEVEAFSARLRLRRQGLPMGLLDPGKSALIKLSDWSEPVIDGQLERAIEAQRPHTTAERLLDAPRSKEASDAAARAADTRSAAKSTATKPRRQASEPGADGDGDAAGHRPLPEADGAPDRPPHLLPPEAF